MKLITDVLRDYRKGRLVHKASDELAAVVKGVVDTGLPGEVTITLKVKPQKGARDQIVIAAIVKAKVPQEVLADAVFFADAEGDLHRDDPKQREMFTTIEATATPLVAHKEAVS